MKLTFPHMGNMYISVKVLLDTIGIDYVISPECNKKTLAYGSPHSPESICLPFKTILGDMLYGIQNGADTVLFGGGCGQCRLGYYGDLQRVIINDLGYDVNFVFLELGEMSFKDMIDKLKPLTKGKSMFTIVKSIILAIKTVFFTEALYDFSNYTRCREKQNGKTDIIMGIFHKKLRDTRGYSSIKRLIKKTKAELKKVELKKDFIPLKVALVGEIYTLLEPFANLEAVKKLGNLGVEVHNHISVKFWVVEHFLKKLSPIRLKNKPRLAAREFIKVDDVGGHGIETIADTIGAKGKFDGVIQIYPLTCMPEIIAQATFSEIQKRYDLPIMTLIVDEMTGEAGYQTRLEAFVDMLERRKQLQEMDLVNAKSGMSELS